MAKTNISSKILLASITLALVGCTKYVNKNVSPEQARYDEMQCEYEADKATASVVSGISRGAAWANVQVGCMRLRGYHLERK